MNIYTFFPFNLEPDINDTQERNSLNGAIRQAQVEFIFRSIQLEAISLD